ncbi:hypothetical protein MK805_09085 [Shimazuella sp. AN120528]|uniref:SPFH domain-containing protein n=1 Tax=Shimazuella soli TaxID=1892854 RepID=UPI001F0D9ED6|nr:SPFH domain-containing protein [Shimazuella soli]MCH5585124.1 hypothetical protein [Shimazuella soli]
MRMLTSIVPAVAGSIGFIAPAFQCFKSIRQGKVGIKFRSGKVVKNKDGSTKIFKAGTHLNVPIIDKFRTIFVNHTKIYNPQVVLLRDNTEFEVRASVWYQITDPEKALVEIEDVQTSLEHLCMTKVQEVLSVRTSKTRDKVADALLAAVEEDAGKWGVKFLSFQLVDCHAVGNTDKIMSMEPKAIASAKGFKVFLRTLFSK